MSGPTITTLKEVRERLLGYRFEYVARQSGISRERLRAVEDENDAPTVFEAESLARLYGVEAERLAEEPVRIEHGDSIRTLALIDEFQDLDDTIRHRIVAAANAARDLVKLRRIENGKELRGNILRLSQMRDDRPPHRQGAEHASELREKLNLKTGPVTSMRDLISHKFPDIVLLYANLTPHGPAGITFADKIRGTVIVLNLQGKNENPCVRRFSLAHELYHVLADWNRREPLALISGYLNEQGLDRERRANAFATRFLCPPSKLKRLQRHAVYEDLAPEFYDYGLHYAALRLYLRNEASVDLPAQPPSSMVPIGTEPKWFEAEKPTGIDNFPIDEVHPERRTVIASTAAQLYSAGKISRARFAEFLGVTPVVDIERVLDFFALDPPEEE
jgi:transcriptional regulator with XRE-family HTH domain